MRHLVCRRVFCSLGTKMRVSSCCGCWTVETGVVIIGSLNVICSVIGILSMAIQGVFILAPFVPQVVYCLCGGLLIVGVQNRKSKYVLPMLSIFFVSLVLGIPVGVVHIIQMSVLFGVSAGYCILILFILGLCFALIGYFHIVVDTFYKELLREEHANPKVAADFNVTLSNKPHFQSV